MGRVVGSVVLAAFGIGAFVLALTSRDVAQSKLALFDTGVRAEAHVVDTRDQLRRKTWRRCFMSYRFGGAVVEREITETDYTVTRRGQTIAVWHDPADPSRFISERERRYCSDEASWGPLSYAAGGLFLLVLAFYVFMDGSRRAIS